jgi:hypothetical protein
VVCANANFFAEKSFSKWRSALAEVFPKYPVSSAAGIGKTNHFGFIFLLLQTGHLYGI